MLTMWRTVLIISAVLIFGAGSLSDLSAENILRLEEISIEGKLQKPQATYILQRARNIDLGTSLELEDEKLTPRIMEDTNREVLQAPE